jgi:phosphate transport system substrate-binding protein
MTIKKIALTILTVSVLNVSAQARDQIKIVGSSTVYPFSSAVAEELGITTPYQTPVVESTGSGGGMKLFCTGNDMSTPDITNASRRMKIKEFKMCAKNGVTDITEVIIGFDGIVFAQSKLNKPFKITKKQLMLATASEVPTKDGKTLVKNPYKYWNEINQSLPHRKIIIYGPPKSSGTRDAFEDMILKSICKKIPAYTNIYKKDKKKYKRYKKFHEIRTDGVYIPSGENDNLIVSKLNKNVSAFGIFGYSFLIENDDEIQGASVDNVVPTPKTISSGKYPISRSLYFYVKNSHFKKVPAMEKYIELFMSENMIGKDSILGEVGLIPLPDKKRKMIQNSVMQKVKLTMKHLSK